ncbi:FRG domain-containing protein [Treponema sp. OMZ 799]|uniref:FRG domain-containing protein n=1 Tax=Treponema sp. OMZ 799 TaxID=2563668 RepID=UPI0020A3A178|nr:FRG domain-containing protein [Treponema sp. OMZ 799]UTC76655.1 FRG domain-containing protein [Treponema sp. OMZ 799]
MNDFIKIYDEIFKENGYVHIHADDLRISNRITFALQKYNETCLRKERITKKMSFHEKYEKLKKENKTSPIYNELLSLFSFKLECENHSPRIKENEINKKRDFIERIIRAENKNADIRVIYNDIIYDAKTVCIEKIESVNQFSTKLLKKELLSKIYYRGQQNINWPVKPSIFRGNWINHEKEFVEEMLINNPQDFDNATTTLEKLTKMQHYNAPTRLLDLTRNPYIALYFACEKVKNSDKKNYGEIIFFTTLDGSVEKYFDSDAVTIVSNLAMMPSDFCVGDESLPIEEFNKQEDISYLLHQIKYEKNNFLDIINHEDLHKCFIVHVKLDNKRIINQQGLFLLVGMGIEKNKPADINKYIYNKGSKKLIFVIPDKVKSEILSQLNIMNINKKFIYPEIDDVADYLKNEKFLC